VVQAPSPDVFESPWTFTDLPADLVSPLPASAEAGGPPVPAGDRAPAIRFQPQVLERLVVNPRGSPTLTERFRRLAAILHHAQLAQGTKIVMVASAAAGDGKTLTVANLGLTLSESYRRRVLLIDADLRRPTLHQIFQQPNAVGLIDGLKSERATRLATVRLTDTLTLLPAGLPDPDPMSALSSPRMREILVEASSRFDWILIDTAPIGLLADANILTTMVDGALFVIRAGKTPFSGVTRALDALGRDRVLGVVLNGAADGEPDNDYSRYYAPPLPGAGDGV
jgi:capsular exopolysaccharide synthesis family protein